MKKLLILIFIAAIGYGIYWYGDRAGWWGTPGPTNLPTREERNRMEAVEEASNQIAPDAKTGVGVVPRGSTPPAPAPTPTTTEPADEPGDESTQIDDEPDPLP